MNKELPKIYEPSKYEKSIYNKWEKSGYFNPDNINAEEKYVNILPPPNANGEMHIGHVSGYVIMDLLGRFNRMLEKKTLLLPGKDHAGIQTQVVYEKKILKEQGKDRHNIGREQFYDDIYDFCVNRAKYIRNQEKSIGLSADWSREKFTLDPSIVKTVKETFVKMYEDVDENGNSMAYRGERIINWCPRCTSALSDFEVEHKKQEAKFYTFKYSKNFPIAISTTRLETKLGDTAVAVNPKDERYKKYIGKIYEVDFVGIKLKLKIIADRGVDMEFGTGALGVTPAHSMVDWQMAEKNNLEIIKVINEDANIKNGFGEYSGMSAKEAREKIAEKLREEKLIEKEEEIDNNLSVCERCKTSIEPLISEQWFIDVDHANFSLKKEARKAIENDKIKIYPERFKKVMLDWIDNVHDWCISRQIWWGPRISAWYKEELKICKVKSQKLKTKKEVYVGISAPEGDGWIQDSDTFDTWFSSGQWAYTTLGFPNGKDCKEFYPSDTMVMGRDILPLWSFRMIILSLYRTRDVPFKNLYFTGLIKDEHGKKMSKSKGNGIEPLEMIKKYGTDAVRLSLIIGSTPGNDINLGEEKIAGFRNFINKLWNISRFISGNIIEAKLPIGSLASTNKLTSADEWILSKFKKLIKQINDDLDNYRFSQAGEALRDFTWNDFADWYLEASKFQKSSETENILIFVLKNLLKLWHPFIPFVTEKIWEELDGDKLLMIEKWPEPSCEKYDSNNFNLIKNIIVSIRNIRAENKVAPSRKIKAILFAKNNKYLIDNKELIKGMKTGISDFEIKEKKEKIQDAIKIVVGDVEIYLLGVVDKEKEKENIKKEIINLEKIIANIEKKLSNKQFIERAPEKIVSQEKDKLVLLKKELKKIVI